MDKVIESWLSFLGIRIFIAKKRLPHILRAMGKENIYITSLQNNGVKGSNPLPRYLLITFKQPDVRQVYKHELPVVVTHSSITVDEIRTCTCPNLQARSKADSPPLFVLQELQPLSNSTSTCTGNK